MPTTSTTTTPKPDAQALPPGAVEMYDATLRDGMQGQGLSLTAAEKLRVALQLDRLGVGVIEAGFPASNPKELEFFSLLEQERLTTSTVAAFGMTRRRDVTADADPGLRVLAESFAPISTIVGKTWGLHLERSCASTATRTSRSSPTRSRSSSRRASA